MLKIKTIHGIEDRKVVSQNEWIAARKKLLAKEKKFSKLRDELNLQRRKLPWVKIEKEYAFDGPSDKLTLRDRKSTRLNSSHLVISYAVFCLKKKKIKKEKRSTV